MATWEGIEEVQVGGTQGWCTREVEQGSGANFYEHFINDHRDAQLYKAAWKYDDYALHDPESFPRQLQTSLSDSREWNVQRDICVL